MGSHTRDATKTVPPTQAIPSTSSSPPDLKSATELEAIARACYTAVNNRHLNISDYPWTPHMSPSFEMDNSQAMQMKTTTLAAMLENFRAIAEAHPSCNIEVESCSTVVGRVGSFGRQRAEVYVNTRGGAGPVYENGLVRNTVTIFEFWREDGVWVANKGLAIDGMGEDRSFN